MKEKLNVWIEPNGKVHHVDVMGHADFVKNYVLSIRGTELHTKICEDLITLGGMTEALHNQGWVRIMQWAWHDSPKVIHTLIKVPKQVVKAITNLYIDYGYPMDTEFI